MLKRFKKRVSNWVFEEIEKDDEDEEEITDFNHQAYRPPEAKMMYQYPKRQSAYLSDKHEAQSIARKKEIPYLTEKSEQPAQLIANRYQRTNRHKNMRTLQEIPAYMRRTRDHKDEVHDQSDVQTAPIEEEKPIISHTRPEELDAVFRKRDNKQDETENNKLDHILKEVPLVEKHHHNEELVKSAPESFAEDIIDEQIEPEIELAKPKVHVKTRDDQISPDKLLENEQHTTELAEQLVTKSDDQIDIPYYLLDDQVEENRDEDNKWIEEQSYLLERTLKHFKVKAHVVNATQGPAVTRFEVKPEIGVKVSRIRNLTDDIKLNLAAKDIRIEAPIPGRHTVGIEVPNKNSYPVGLQEIIQTDLFNESESPLTIGLGLTIEGDPLVTTINQMPHCLIAGATGSGKSVCINTILLSLMYKANYEDVKFLLIDPKMVELAPYNDIPHLISPVITDVKAATASLKWAVSEMERRYELFAQSRVRDVTRFNDQVAAGKINEEKMPYIVIVIDELADLMMAAPQDVEDAICRIAQKARACGIHLLLATQRPSVDVITGLIKANIPTRISFSVTSQVDSRTIIDMNGAEQLLGKGDMLFVKNGSSEIIRLQGPFVSDDEIERVTAHFRSIAEPNYLFEQDQLLEEVIKEEEEDDLLEDVIHFVIEHSQASTSLLQRRFRIGYNRAARIIDTLEARGVVSAQNGTKPRDVLITQSQLQNDK